MYKLELKNRIVEIPTNIKEITISQFEKVVSAYKKSYLTSLDRNIEIVKAISNLSEEETDELLIEEFNKILSNLDMNDIGDITNSLTEIIINNIKYKTSYPANSFKFTIKEHKEIRNIIINNSDSYVSYLMAILFREINPDGTISKDLSNEAITKRKEIFKEVKVDIIGPYILMLRDQFDVGIS